MIDTVIFDLGQVLVDFNPDKGMRTLGFSDEEIDEFNEKIFAKVWEECDRIPYSDSELRTLLKSKVPGFENAVDKLVDNIDVVTDVRIFADEWIRSLKDKGYKVYVLSNFGKTAFEFNSKKYDFLSYMDGIVVSYEIEKCKPEPDIYNELTKRYGVIPENSVFIDDRIVNVEGAVKLDFNGIVFKDYKQARAELSEMLG